MSHGKLGNLTHEQRMRAIKRMREQMGIGEPRKRGRLSQSVVAFPDLSCATTDQRRVAPTSDRIVPVSTAPRTLPKGAKQFPSATLFKQGPQLITPGDIATGRVHDYGGHKPNKGSYN